MERASHSCLPPELSWLMPAAYLSVTAQGGLFHGNHLFSDKRNPSPLDVKDFCAPSPGVTATSSSVTKVPHLHRCPWPRVTSSSHARAAVACQVRSSQKAQAVCSLWPCRPLPVCPHWGPGLACWLLSRLPWAGWGLLARCWCGVGNEHGHVCHGDKVCRRSAHNSSTDLTWRVLLRPSAEPLV